jgi:hypothetical protein
MADDYEYSAYDEDDSLMNAIILEDDPSTGGEYQADEVEKPSAAVALTHRVRKVESRQKMMAFIIIPVLGIEGVGIFLAMQAISKIVEGLRALNSAVGELQGAALKTQSATQNTVQEPKGTSEPTDGDNQT